MDDEDLSRRLADALHDEADRAEPPAGAWDRFQARISAGPHTRSTGGPSARRSVRWRVPLIAAAAVTVIAVATAAIVTGGFGTIRQPTAAGPDGSGGASGVTVTIATAPGGVGAADGVGVETPPDRPPPADSARPPSAGASTSPTITAPRTSTPSQHVSPGTVTMSFEGGTPPAAALHGIVTGPDGTRSDAGRHTFDGTPLGYLTLTGDGTGGHYLWGAVGPDVLQVQIGAVQPAEPGDIDPGFHAGPNWIIDAGTGTPWSLPEAATTVWSDLGDGWHGFAVRIPSDATQVSVIAMGGGARMLQNRLWDPAAGSHTDGPLAGSTGGPPVTAGTRAGFSSADTTPSSYSGPRPIVATFADKPGMGGMDALFDGVVGLTNGCVTAGGQSGTAVTLVFPASLVTAADPPGLVTYRGTTYHQGDRITLAGGLVPDYDVPAGCPSDAWIVNPFG